MGVLGTDYIVRYLSDIKDAVKGAKNLETINAATAKKIQDQYGQAVAVIGKLQPNLKIAPITSGKFAGLNKEILTTGEIVKTTNGSFLEMSQTQTLIGGQLQSTSGNVKDVTNQFVKNNIEIAKSGKFFSNLGDNVKQLAARAILTIPIWIALRAAITGLFQGISGGIKDLIAFDLALQKIRNNLQGTPQEVSIAFKKIRSEITQASKETGRSTEEIATAVKQFATLGFNAEESLSGALGATKLSIALFGDAGETAGAFAKAINILANRSQGAKSVVDQMNEAFALTSQLEEKNNFEIKNVTEALDKFAGTAAGVGLTMNQTLQILAALGTAGRQGSEGATLLSTSFNQLLTNLPKLQKTLGLVNITGESTFDTFRRILNEVVRLNQTPGGQPASIKAISDIFGGARGIKIVQSLVAVKNILDENINTLPNFNALNEKVKRTLETESGQAQILSNNLKEAGKSFIIAFTGSEDFTGAIINLNKAIVSITEPLKTLGVTLRVIFDNLGLIAGTSFVISFLKVVTIEKLFAGIAAQQAAAELLGIKLAFIFSKGWLVGFKTLGKLALSSLATSFATGGIITSIGTILAAIFTPLTIGVAVGGKILGDVLINNWRRRIEERNKEIIDQGDKIIQALKGGLSIPELTALIGKLTLELPKDKIDFTKIKAVAGLRKQLEKQLNFGEIKAGIPVDFEPVISFAEEQDIAKKILQNKLEQLRLQGATNKQLAEAEILGTQALNIKEDELSLLNQQLNLEKAIQQEKRLQNKLGADSVKLFDIAQKEGIQVAKQIGDVLAGETDFSNFIRRGGRAVEVFKEEFADLFKQQQALQFFSGERVSGLPDLRGGTRIAIEEDLLRGGQGVSQAELQIALEKAKRQFQQIQQINTTVPVQITNNIDISKLNEVKKAVIDQIVKDGPKAGTNVNNMLVQALQGKQGTTL